MTDDGAPRAGRLAGRVVVTSDAAVARAVAAEGATVVLVGTDATMLGRLAGEVRALGGRAAVVVGDLTDPDTGPTTRQLLVDFLAELFPEH